MLVKEVNLVNILVHVYTKKSRIGEWIQFCLPPDLPPDSVSWTTRKSRSRDLLLFPAKNKKTR